MHIILIFAIVSPLIHQAHGAAIPADGVTGIPVAFDEQPRFPEQREQDILNAVNRIIDEKVASQTQTQAPIEDLVTMRGDIQFPIPDYPDYNNNDTTTTETTSTTNGGARTTTPASPPTTTSLPGTVPPETTPGTTPQDASTANPETTEQPASTTQQPQTTEVVPTITMAETEPNTATTTSVATTMEPETTPGITTATGPEVTTEAPVTTQKPGTTSSGPTGAPSTPTSTYSPDVTETTVAPTPSTTVADSGDFTTDGNDKTEKITTTEPTTDVTAVPTTTTTAAPIPTTPYADGDGYDDFTGYPDFDDDDDMYDDDSEESNEDEDDDSSEEVNDAIDNFFDSLLDDGIWGKTILADSDEVFDEVFENSNVLKESLLEDELMNAETDGEFLQRFAVDRKQLATPRNRQDQELLEMSGKLLSDIDETVNNLFFNVDNWINKHRLGTKMTNKYEYLGQLRHLDGFVNGVFKSFERQFLNGNKK